MCTPSTEIRTWSRTDGDVVYTCSTDPSLVDLGALNAAFKSDMLWWAKDLPSDALRTTVDHSLCFSIYAKSSTSEKQPMIAFGRLITDYVTFAYLTDVYVLPEYQGKGLGRWMMDCLNEVLNSWPHLRRCVLFTRDAHAVKLYEKTLGMYDVKDVSGGLIVMQCLGRGAVKKVTEKVKENGVKDGFQG